MFCTISTKNLQSHDAWLAEILTKIPPDFRILDACAREQQSKNFGSLLNRVSQVFAQYNNEGDRRSLQTKKWDNSILDITSDTTSFPGSYISFDAIMCIEIFKHLLKPILNIKEFNRLLKPEGHLIVTAPFWSLIYIAHYHFYLGYNRYFFEIHFLYHKFIIIEKFQKMINYFKNLVQEFHKLFSIEQNYTGVKLGIFDRIAKYLIVRPLKRSSRIERGLKDLPNLRFYVNLVKKDRYS